LKSCFAVHGDEVTYKLITDTSTIQEWLSKFPIMECTIVYWVLKSKSQKLIQRDPEWWPTHFPEMKSTWEEILTHREAGTLPTAPTTILQL
jgi:hypothetical protein